MRITIYEWSAPVCKCGEKMEIYLALEAQKVRTKCLYCGYERWAVIPGDISSLSVKTIADVAHILLWNKNYVFEER